MLFFSEMEVCQDKKYMSASRNMLTNLCSVNDITALLRKLTMKGSTVNSLLKVEKVGAL